MAKTTKVTKRVVRKRKERKNVERGAAHIASSFNNTIVTITDTPCPGPLPADSASAAARSLRPLRRRWRRRPRPRRPWSMA